MVAKKQNLGEVAIPEGTARVEAVEKVAVETPAAEHGQKLTVAEAIAWLRTLPLPPEGDCTELVREMRDAR